MMILVSACLLGHTCRYDGQSKPHPGVAELLKQHTLVPICPEVQGGLPTPRPPAEIQGDRVINSEGRDVTGFYQRGAQAVLELAKILGADTAILKQCSPSCGSGIIHNGQFDGGLIDGWGVAAKLLRDNGIAVYSEDDVGKLL